MEAVARGGPICEANQDNDKSAGKPIWTQERSECARRARCRMHRVNLPEGENRLWPIRVTDLLKQIWTHDESAGQPIRTCARSKHARRARCRMHRVNCARRVRHRDVPHQLNTRHADFQSAALPENNLVSTVIQILFPAPFALLDLFFCPVRH